jgi:superfamily II DNA or RNA helicase
VCIRGRPSRCRGSAIQVATLGSGTLAVVTFIAVEIGSHLRLRESDLPLEIAEELKTALSIPNEAKNQARKEKLDDWYLMPDSIELWRSDSVLGKLILPRGFKSNLERGLKASGFEIVWEDERSNVPMDKEYQELLYPIELREHQSPAVESLMFNQQGIYEAPPGSGKTVTVLEAIRRSHQRAIVLVDKSNLAEQWRAAAKQFLGVETGFIGDGVWDPGEITIALKQTLWSRRRELKAEGFFDEWGLVAYDECHHITAETYQFVVQQFSPKYLFGVSATPARVPWTFPIATSLLGPIVHKTLRATLQSKRILMRPKIKVVPTDFNYDFLPTRINKGGYRIASNYPRMMKALVEDDRRNDKIVDLIMDDTDRHILVVSKRHEHFKRLTKKLVDREYPHEILSMTGKESREERMVIQDHANLHPCVVLSTVADEGVDIPCLDTIFLIWPTRNIAVVRQQIGRVERYADKKPVPIVYDIYDPRVQVLKRQFSERCAGVYRAEELELEYI